MAADVLTVHRMRAQGLATPHLPTPADVVRRLGAVQAQDVRASHWAVGLRTAGDTEAAVADALADRSLVRTWPLRGTLHLVPAEDVRWMLAHLAPRVLRQAARRYGQLELDDDVFTRSANALAAALEGGHSLTRDAAYATLEEAGVSTEGQRGYHILYHLGHTGLLCFGAPEGKQQTVVLLDEWAAPASVPPRDEALARLAVRYMTGHGPATADDFAWWAGLTLTDARAALDAASGALTSEPLGDRTYWRGPIGTEAGAPPRALLLPVYDELTVGYRDRSAVLRPSDAERAGNGIFRPVLLVDGHVVGVWRRTLRADTVRVELSPFEDLGSDVRKALDEAAARYAAFLGLRLALD